MKIEWFIERLNSLRESTYNHAANGATLDELERAIRKLVKEAPVDKPVETVDTVHNWVPEPEPEAPAKKQVPVKHKR
jgi:hypothetical protein